MKILIIGPSWVGDMVMSQSLYITLKKLYPSAVIDVMAPAWCKPILERMPEVNQALDMPFQHGEFKLFERIQVGQSLKTTKYNHAFILPNSAKSALIPFFANIPKRTGWKGEMRYGLLNDLRLHKKSFQYMIERYIALAFTKEKMHNSSSLGEFDGLPKPVLLVNKDKQLNIIERFNIQKDMPILGFCPGAEFGVSKQWPKQYFADVANEMVKKGYQVCLFGSLKDKETTDKIRSLIDKDKQEKIHNLAGNTTLTEVIDLLAACEVVVSNDTGLMHVAAAVRCKIVAVYGSSSPKYTPPLTDAVEIVHTDIACRPCFKKDCEFSHMKCMTEIKPSLVIQSIRKLTAISLSNGL